MFDQQVYVCGDFQIESGEGHKTTPVPLPLPIKTARVKMVAAGGSLLLICTDTNHLLVKSSNMGTSLMPLELHGRKNLPEISQIAAGYTHGMVWTEDGKLYGFGRNSEHQLTKHCVLKGVESREVTEAFEIGRLPFKHLKKLICRFNNSAVITPDGGCYVTGCNTEQLTSIEGPSLDCFTKIHLEDNKRVAHISFGDSHSVIVTENGELYTAGSNGYGQMGSGSPQKTFQKVKAITERVKFAECGYYHTIAITEGNQIWGCGWNAVGELGIADVGDQHKFVLAKFIAPEPIVYMSVGFQQTFIRLKNGKMFCCGFNSYGGLGLGDTDPRSTYVPFELPKMNKAVCGGHFTTFYYDSTLEMTRHEKHMKECLKMIFQRENSLSDIALLCQGQY